MESSIKEMYITVKKRGFFRLKHLQKSPTISSLKERETPHCKNKISTSVKIKYRNRVGVVSIRPAFGRFHSIMSVSTGPLEVQIHFKHKRKTNMMYRTYYVLFNLILSNDESSQNTKMTHRLKTSQSKPSNSDEKVVFSAHKNLQKG